MSAQDGTFFSGQCGGCHKGASRPMLCCPTCSLACLWGQPEFDEQRPVSAQSKM